MEKTLKEQLYETLPQMPLKDFFGYLNEIEMGYIKANYHPEDNNLVILNYTKYATFERRWNKYTMSARGLIIDLTELKNNGIIYILARPFGKFPNFGEMPDYEKDINLNDIESSTEKMDGSLGISYFFNDEIRFATRGSFISEQAVKATEMWKKYQANDKLFMDVYINAPVTFLTEIIYPENRIVVDYEGEEKLVLLGMTYLYGDDDKSEANYNDLLVEADILKMEVPHFYKLTIPQMLELKKKLPASHEGWVVKFRNGKRLKIKGNEYMAVHAVMYGISDKNKVKAWAEGGFKDYIIDLPEEFRPELERFADELDKLKDSLYTMLQGFYEMIDEMAKDQKDFARLVNGIVSVEYRKFIFEARKTGSVPVELICKHIYKNYQEYIEVIRTWNKQD